MRLASQVFWLQQKSLEANQDQFWTCHNFRVCVISQSLLWHPVFQRFCLFSAGPRGHFHFWICSRPLFFPWIRKQFEMLWSALVGNLLTKLFESGILDFKLVEILFVMRDSITWTILSWLIVVSIFLWISFTPKSICVTADPSNVFCVSALRSWDRVSWSRQTTYSFLMFGNDFVSTLSLLWISSSTVGYFSVHNFWESSLSFWGHQFDYQPY